MDLRAKRLHSPRDLFRGYHLFDRGDSLVLVAESGMPWSPRGQVRFATGDGTEIATMPLTTTAVWGKFNRKSLSYAIVRHHKVYAVVNQYQQDDTWPYFVLEVEDLRWLMLREQKGSPGKRISYEIYDQVPANIRFQTEPFKTVISEAVGHIEQTADPYHYTVVLPAKRPIEVSLVVLALIFLIDGIDKTLKI